MNYNIEEIKDILKYIISNNAKLQEQGNKAIAVSLKSDPGIGKTSCIEQIGDELGYKTIIIRLSNIEDPSDLLGFPIAEYEVCGGEGCRWIPKDILPEYIKAGYNVTGNKRMGYSIPQWLPQDEQPVLLCLDDYSRSNPLILQAVMEIVHEQKYLSWSLPKGSNIILTENPDNGDYQVTSVDDAFRSRFVTFDVEFDVKVWAKWAEESGIRGSAINFMLYAPELITEKKNKTINARSMTMFFNAISGLEDWSTPSNLAFILSIADGCFKDDTNVVGNMFTTFINNKMDKLISPEDMVRKSWDSVQKTLEGCLYEGDQYRADIASILSIRFVNYVAKCFDNKTLESKEVIDRILELIDEKNEKVYLTEDLIFNMIKTITTKYPTRTKKLLTNKKVIKKII
jgi:hypothetical protein